MFYILPSQASTALAEPQKSIYCQEFEGLNAQWPYSVIFSDDSDDANSNQALMETKRTYNEQEKKKHITLSQKISQPKLFSNNLVVIPPTAMPNLYGYIRDICKQHNISMPLVCSNLDRTKCRNYAACTNGGLIIINPKTFESSDKVVEAIIAHELGHIKHHHPSKFAALATLFVLAEIKIAHSYLFSSSDSVTAKIIKTIGALGLGFLITNKFFIPFISRRFEQQADEFAYKDCNKAEGFIELVAPGAEQERIQRDSQLKADKQCQEENLKLPLATRIKETTVALIEDIPALIDEGLYWLLTNKVADTHTSYETQLKAVREYLATHTISKN